MVDASPALSEALQAREVEWPEWLWCAAAKAAAENNLTLETLLRRAVVHELELLRDFGARQCDGSAKWIGKKG